MTRKRINDKLSKVALVNAYGEDYTGRPASEYTNEGNTAFCPFLDHARLAKMICSQKGEGIIHRSYPTGQLPPNNRYHWLQLAGFENVQICKLNEIPVSSIDMCEKGYKDCAKYKLKIGTFSDAKDSSKYR